MTSSSKEEALWEAATQGDLALVKQLAMEDSEVDVNWTDPEWERTPFYRACYFGRTSVVEWMMRVPRVDVGKIQKQGCSPFFIACQEGHQDLVLMLLADPRTDVGWPMDGGESPFFIACQEGRADVVALLLLDPRIDVNTTRKDNSSPLWFAAQNGQLEVARFLLASDRTVDTAIKSSFNGKTAAEHGRQQPLIPKGAKENDAKYQRRRANAPLIADLIDEYEKSPITTRRNLRKRPGIRGPWPLSKTSFSSQKAHATLSLFPVFCVDPPPLH